ncbi:Oidioi.mRNA.OKI2018_I69.XSR.g14624.t1.cds [Oikopleura dioica]|uniref:Signal peptidase complex subunit 1 n=1 Tax=Oikopleura dioica TaxID=34765 RepID=A0ABN7SJB7_OIKDI|nr:Oidioi.mRNA.OKI2018_I69.XSR.g14624.t1.cds [Oikopleura dioica]
MVLALIQEAGDWLNNYMGRWWYVDYKGQARAEKMFQVILVLSGVIGWIYGFLTESMQNGMIVLGGGAALSSLLTIPPWFWLRPQEKELKWHEELDEDDPKLYPSWEKKE